MKKFQLIVISFLALCGCVTSTTDEVERYVMQTIQAKSCTVVEQEDISGEKPKTLLITVDSPTLTAFDADIDYIGSRIALFITDSLINSPYKDYGGIKLIFAKPGDTTLCALNFDIIRKSKKFIGKAQKFTNSFVVLDTNAVSNLVNTSIDIDQITYAMDIPKHQRDTFGAVTSLNFLGYVPSVSQSGEPIIAVRYLVTRKNKPTERYEVLVGRRDTLVNGFSWQLLQHQPK